MLWEKELMSYKDYPPLQQAASYNLDQILDQIKEMGRKNPSQ
jgi:arylsulfatase